jgi:hypothetical protein
MQKDATIEYVVMHMAADRLTKVEEARLWHHRLSHPAPAVPYTMARLKLAEDNDCPIELNEDCPGCDQSKFRCAPFPRVRDPGKVEALEPWEKVYVDGYGGQKSLGTTIGGAKKGFVFVWAKSNVWKKILVISDKQFPNVLRKSYLWVDMQHFRVRVLVCDTYVVNISQAVEDMAEEFDCTMRPVSTGTPQEMGKTEKAFQELRRMTWASFASAPHLGPIFFGDSRASGTLGFTMSFPDRKVRRPDSRYVRAENPTSGSCSCTPLAALSASSAHEGHSNSPHQQEHTEDGIRVLSWYSVADGARA